MSTGPDQALAARDLELVREAAQGDGSAFTRFYERHAPAVQLLVERLLGPGEDADRVVVEAFEKTVRRLPLLGTRNSSPAIYVLTTARNGAYAALGRGRPESPEPKLAALLALPSRQRELLALRELGLDDAQCGEVAGIEPGDVPAQIARARVRLADELDGQSLSGVFVDARAELLLTAAEARDGDPALHAEADERAGSDERFAAALSAVRAGGRRITELPAATGADRLADVASRQALGGAPPSPAAAPVPTPAPPAQPLDDGRYDDIVGDEAAWGITDEDDLAADRPTTAGAAEPPVGLPDALLDDEQPTAFSSPDGPHAPQPQAAPLTPQAAQPAPDSATTPSAGDTFDGWDALDWVDDDAASAEPATSVRPAAPAGRAPSDAALTPSAALPDPGATMAFDAVAAGLADPDREPIGAGAAALAEARDPLDGDQPPRRRGRWWLWLLAAVLLFGAAALGAYLYFSDDSDADPAPAMQTDAVPPTTAQDRGGDGRAAERTKQASSRDGGEQRAPRSTGSSSSSTESPGAGGGSVAASGSGTGGASPGGSAQPASGSAGGSASGGATTRPPEPSVEGGESSSGGSVRGDATSTTP